MKIYIKNTSEICAEASSELEGASTAFLDRTDNDHYMDILNHPESYPNMTAEVVWMSPDDFIQHCATGVGVSVDDVIDAITDDDMEKYAKQMRSGTKFNMPWLRYVKNGSIEHEGRHRALAAKSNGDKFIPVLVVKDNL